MIGIIEIIQFLLAFWNDIRLLIQRFFLKTFKNRLKEDKEGNNNSSSMHDEEKQKQQEQEQQEVDLIGIHCRQKYDWDCGLACCVMILNWLGIESSPLYNHPLAQLGSPLWTIDLLLLLHDHNVETLMVTKSLGVKPHHEDIAWYATSINHDKDRIEQQFRLAAQLGLEIRQSSTEISEIQSLLDDSHHCLIILLVDSITLRRGSPRDAYSGHFILLVGYNAHSDTFTFLDPSKPSGLLHIPSTVLDAARRHPGTDEDMILCYRRRQSQTT